MAFFQLLMKANKIEKSRIVYHDEKLHAIEMSKGIKPHYTLSQKIRMRKIMLKMKVMGLLRRLTCWQEDSWCYRTISLLKTDGTFANFLMKSIIGFLSGVLLTYMLFLFMVFHLNFTLFTATMFSSLFGIILTIGLAFSYRVRCVVFLLLPQFFSKRGRQALIAYAFILTLTGPTKNTLNNVQVLSESLTCGQEELQKTITSTIELIKQPFHALHDTIAKLLKSMKEIVKKVEKTLLAIKRVVINILRVIKSAFEWLGSIVSICNKKVGTPYERCSKVFEGAVADCHARLGPFFGGICSLTYIVSVMCYLVKPLDFICILVSFTSDIIVDTIRKKIKKFSSHMKVMFYVKVNFTHSFHFETNKSKSYENVAIEIVNEIKARAERFQTIFNWMNLITSFFILCMLLRVLRYHRKWLTSDRYDNKYLTNYFRHIDLMRTKKDKETVLPLNKREKRKYIPLTSITMTAVERNKLLRSVLFLSLTTFNICIHITVDYSLFWILDIIRYHGRFQTKVQQSNSVGLYISGTGYLAELYRSIIRTFSPENFNSEMDTLPCLPDPLPPDYDRYTQIAVLIISCWIMTIFEPYGLRLRQVVMGRYYPDRAKQRAVYLYNEIIRSRGNFLKFARRQLRRKYGMNGDKNIEQVTFKERLLAICPKLNICFPQKNKMCLLCGDVEREGRTQHVKCPDPSCIGLFCMECFADLQNICTICKTPMEYGDLSDISEEKDSSDDDIPKTSARERGGKCELIDEKLQSMETTLTNWRSEKIRDDVTIQIFNESLRGGADASSQNFTFNKYEMYEFSSPSIFSSSVNETVSCSTEEMVETELTYTEIDEDRNETNHNHLKEKNSVCKYGTKSEMLKMANQSNGDKYMKISETQGTANQNFLLGHERFGKRQSPGYKWSKIYKRKFTSKERIINSSTPVGFSSNQNVGNTSNSVSNFEMNNYYYRKIDDTDSTNDDHKRSRKTQRKCFTVRTRYMHESNKCHAINERNPMQSETSLNVGENAETGTTSRCNLETFIIDSDSQTSSGELFSLNESSESTPELSKLSDLSIGIDTESSSETQRRREIIRWYQKNLAKNK